MNFECVFVGSILLIDRAAVPGGWFVFITHLDANIRDSFFYPDPEHKWDGKSLEL